MFRRLVIGTLATMGMLIPIAPTPSMSSEGSPVGVRNPSAPAQLQQLAFLVGDWSAAVVLHRPSGDLAFEARWHNTWIVNGFAIMQEWRDPYSAGAELRTYNSQTGRWEGRNFYAGWNTWTESEGSFANGEFVIETRSVDANGPFLSRERYFDIRPKSFRMVAKRSRDGGQTWTAPVYEMVCTRIV